jgi:hypothetical protein
VVAALLAAGLAWHAFPASRGEAAATPISREMLQAVDSREWIGLARGVLLWGPLCILSVWAPPLEMARYAVAARTALIVDYFLPALNMTGCRETLIVTQRTHLPRRLLVQQLAAALVYSSVLVAPLLLLSAETLKLYGSPYDSHLNIYALLLGVQWVNGVGRPALRQAVVRWDARRIGLTLGSGAVAVVLVCALGVASYGALAAAAASLIGALLVNARAIVLALAQLNRDESAPDTPAHTGTS